MVPLRIVLLLTQTIIIVKLNHEIGLLLTGSIKENDSSCIKTIRSDDDDVVRVVFAAIENKERSANM